MNITDIFINNKNKFNKIISPIRVLGIDLGTTNSAVAEIIFDPQKDIEIKAECLPVTQETESGNTSLRSVPSVVAIKSNKIFVGEGAKRMIPKIADRQFKKDVNIFYECKNDIGTKKIYHKAPEGFKTPAEISGKILEFIYNSVKEYNEIPVEKTVVTVPASFHPSQRMDTVTAAGLGGIFSIDKGDLLDEPLAAFISFVMNEGLEIIENIQTTKNILVFDFGGGTCDVSIFEVEKFILGENLKINYKSVSRYHRLGGGDIDRAIVYDILIPQLIRQNNIPKSELTYDIKKIILEAGLTGIAESLKIGISNEISRLKKFGKYPEDNTGKETIVKLIPSEYKFKIGNREYKLSNPCITANEFEDTLKDFLNTDLLYARETEYKLVNSIFAPIQDSLDRCNLDETDIDFVLLTGGSSYIPFIKEKVQYYFKNAGLLEFEDEEKYHTSIAIGAAYHSFFKFINGTGLIEQVNHYGISINTQKGLVELVPRNVTLPYPSENTVAKNYDLKIPDKVDNIPFKLSVEIFDTDTEMLLTRGNWEIDNETYLGEKIVLEYRMNTNGIIEMRFSLLNYPDKKFKKTIENPFMNTIIPDTKKIQIEELEHILKTENLTEDEKYEKFYSLANLYNEIGYYEKSIALYLKILNHFQGESDDLFNKLGGLYDKTGDLEKMEMMYKEGYRKTGWNGLMFNLALKQYNLKKFSEALENIEIALFSGDEGPYLVLKAMIFEKMQREEETKETLDDANDSFRDIEFMTDWELGWYLTYCKMKNDTEEEKKARNEIKSRCEKTGRTFETDTPGILPTK